MSYNFNADYDKLDNMEKPQAMRIAEWVKKVVNPNKVIDAGCGPGTYVYAMRSLEINAFGYDLDPRVKDKQFLTNKDLLDIDDHGDMVMCLEVVEHIDPKESQKIVDKLYNMVNNAGILLFSAGHVGQSGTDHINCRPKEFWQHLFYRKGLIRCPSLEHQLINIVKTTKYLGWLPINLMIFYKHDEESTDFTSGSLRGPYSE